MYQNIIVIIKLTCILLKQILVEIAGKNSKEVLSYLLMYQAGKENNHCVYIWVCMSIFSVLSDF